MGTPHIEAEKEDIASVVIMPGDPLRAKLIAETYLKDVKQINRVRNMFGYTGYYKGKRVTVMGSGMGMASMGIYSYELFKFYDVDKIIRVGTCGCYKEELNLLDIILADKAYTEGRFAYSLNDYEGNIIEASEELTNKIEEKSKEVGINVAKGTIMTGDCFDLYITNIDSFLNRIPKDIKPIGAEMEAFALFYVAKMLGKEAACLATVVDSIHKKESIDREVREKSLNKMIELALEAI
jgi:purine-nucleoside phosphorylase